MPSPAEIVLYRATGPHWWLTNATFDENEGLTVCSGGHGSREWYLKIGRKHVAALAQALQGPPAAPEAGVLELMQQRFGGGAENPFEAIKQLLLDRQIPFDDSVW
jgi:hypothetical protein